MPSAPTRPLRAVSAWACVGLGGSTAVALSAPQLVGGPVSWWYHPGVPGRVAVFYAGIVALSVAWLALRRFVEAGAVSARRLSLVAAAWCLPLALGPPLFSHDAYSYLAQGTLVHLGLDPYHVAPAVLAQHGQAHVLSAVDPFWRHTTAPYGPLYLWIVSWFSGASPVLGVLLIRALGLVGFGLLAVFVPRLARGLGGDGARAIWWVLLSPLVALGLIGGAHNDILMIGLLVAGVTLAVEDRPLLGIAVCALAAAVKLPAAAAIVFIAVVWARERPTRPEQLRRIAAGALVALSVIVAISALSGLGAHWISSSVFSAPGKVRLAITPATALGWTAAHLGVPVRARELESAFGVLALAFVMALALVLVWRARRATMVRYLGIVLLAAAIGGPAAWPWYLTWGLVLLAACPETQRSRALPFGVIAAALVVKADGILAFPLHTAPVFAALYVAAAVALVVSRRRPALVPTRWRARALAGS